MTASDTPGDVSSLHRGLDALLRDAMALRTGERLLVYADESPGIRLANSMRARADAMGAAADVLTLDATGDVRDSAKQLAEHCREGRYHAVCELSMGTYYLTGAWDAARDAGARFMSLQGLDEESFVRCVARVDQTTMHLMCLALRDRLRGARRLRVTSPAGTDFTMQLGVAPPGAIASRLPEVARRIGRRAAEALGSGSLASRFGPHPRAALFEPGGVLRGKSMSTFLGGQVALRGIPFSASGTLVVDGSLFLGATGRPLCELATLRIRRGMIVGVASGDERGEEILESLGDASFAIEHVCFGLNPSASPEGHLLERERVLAGVTVGFGRGFRHADCVMRHPVTELDGRIMARDGRFTDPSLLPIQEQLVRPS